MELGGGQERLFKENRRGRDGIVNMKVKKNERNVIMSSINEFQFWR